MGQPTGDDAFAEAGHLANAQYARCEGRLDFKIWQVCRLCQSGRQKKVSRGIRYDRESERGLRQSRQRRLRPIRERAVTRYKGRMSAKMIERDFPHVVETVIPAGGLGKTLDAMHEFHKRYKIEVHTGKGHRDRNGRDYIRWCFANPGIAAKFASQFVRK